MVIYGYNILFDNVIKGHASMIAANAIHIQISHNIK